MPRCWLRISFTHSAPETDAVSRRAGISPRTVEFLRQIAHDVVHVRELNMQRAVDEVVADRARAESRIVLTFDLDFGEVLALGILDRPSVVIFRLADERPESVNAHLGPVLAGKPVLVVTRFDRVTGRRKPFLCAASMLGAKDYRRPPP